MSVEILVAGALHLDVVVDAPHLPATDETVVGASVAYRFGGKGGNQAVMAARMGSVAGMAGRVGRDRFGAQLLAALDAAGVDRSQVRQTDGASGMSVAIVDAGGNYGAVIVSGVNRDIRADDIALHAGLRVLLLQNEIPQDVNLALARRVPDETTVILNAAPACDVRPELLARTDILVVNRVEAAQMTGTAIAAPLEAAGALAAKGPKEVIVTLGAEGLVACAPPHGVLTMPAPAVPVASTHGAGDAFTGALAAELSRGASLHGALRFAQAAAALTVQTPPDDRGRIGEASVRAALDQAPTP